ncbi:MAG: 1-deoxy-D-xylulose-5-phosphate synthase [Candidatus Methylacidiphilales bacterium]
MTRILDSIDSPADLKKLPMDKLPVLAEEIRQELITTLSKTGGHLGPNLGVVELTIAMHRVFDTPKDNFVFDVSHQAYVHKLLTGRRKEFHKIRQPGGPNGFMVRAESPHDCFGAGHAGTALSAALGMATARDLRGTDEHVVALAGDAAFTCGVSFEALNNVCAHTKRMIIVLNDNEWSIDKNVGAIADYFNKIVTNPNYSHLHDKAESFLKRIAGDKILEVAHRIEEAAKGLVLPSVIFEELGLHYYGPVDGHDTVSLIKTFEFLKEQTHPVILHVLTQKGRGFKPALEKQKAFHGTGAFDPETGEAEAGGPPTFSKIFAESLSKFAENNNKIVAITGGMPNGTGLDKFSPQHPDRYFDVGIAEEHAVIFAAGLATKGFKPVCAIYSTFLQRAFDQIVHDVCLQNLNVVFCMDRGGLSGDDGPTHHGIFDIAYLRSIPNLVHMSPKDEDEFVDMLWTALHYSGPIALRYPRGYATGATIKPQPQLLTIGKAEVLKQGSQIAVWSYGKMAMVGEDLVKQLEARGFSTALINGRFAKPLDHGTLDFFGRSTDLIITLEDHVLEGGFGSIVSNSLVDLGIQTPVVRIGWPDQFIEHGKEDQLRAKYGLTVEAALEKSAKYLAKIKPAGSTAKSHSVA